MKAYGAKQLLKVFPQKQWTLDTRRIKLSYKVIILTRRCLIGTTTWYLAANCIAVSEMAQRRHLCSAAGHQLVVPSELMWLLDILCTRSEAGTLCLDCCETLATTLLALDILSLRALVHTVQSSSS